MRAHAVLYLNFIYPKLDLDVNHKTIMLANSYFFQIQIYIFQASDSLKIIYMSKIGHHFKYF